MISFLNENDNITWHKPIQLYFSIKFDSFLDNYRKDYEAGQKILKLFEKLPIIFYRQDLIEFRENLLRTHLNKLTVSYVLTTIKQNHWMLNQQPIDRKIIPCIMIC